MKYSLLVILMSYADLSMMKDCMQGLIRKQALSSAELAEIQQLAQLCNAYENLDMKLNWDILRHRSPSETNDFLYYYDGRLVGYLALFAFNTREAELSGMVHPEQRRKGIFSLLIETAVEECRQRCVPELLYIVEHRSSSGTAWIATRPVLFEHAEYKMALSSPRLPGGQHAQIFFRKAFATDSPILTKITALAFDLPENEVDWYAEKDIQASNRGYYVGELAGEVIGKIEVLFNTAEAFIYGFGVLPKYRGKGYGRQILSRTIQEILSTGRSRVVLEVAVKNSNALLLYQSCGFEETSRFDYYQQIL